MNKQLLQCFKPSEESAESLPPILGSKHTNRVFVPSPPARKLLLRFAGLHPGHKQQRNLPVSPLSQNEYRQLISLLRKHEHLVPLVDFLDRISQSGVSGVSPLKYQCFLQDLARNSPASSLLQTDEHSKVRHIIKEIVIKGINIFQSCHKEKLTVLQTEAPIICSFLCNVSDDGCLPTDVRRLIQSLMLRCKVPYPSQSTQQYLPPCHRELFDGLGFFPNMPEVQGSGNYSIDCKAESRACREADTCNKFSQGHPTLSPGLFTVYCPHKICVGFQVMDVHESPATPFNIIIKRMRKAPRIIIYDNACKLHQYCLNREPDFFKTTMFLVDRLHWGNHIGCSSGYNMAVYKADRAITQLNSQVCEQSNASISRIKAQLSYMLPDNFIFHAALFLGITNMKAKNSC